MVFLTYEFNNCIDMASRISDYNICIDMAYVQYGILTHKSQINASWHRYGFNHKTCMRTVKENYPNWPFECIRMHHNHLNVRKKLLWFKHIQPITFVCKNFRTLHDMRMVSFVESQWRMFESTRSKRCISDWRIEDIILIRDSFMILLAWIWQLNIKSLNWDYTS